MKKVWLIVLVLFVALSLYVFKKHQAQQEMLNNDN